MRSGRPRFTTSTSLCALAVLVACHRDAPAPHATSGHSATGTPSPALPSQGHPPPVPAAISRAVFDDEHFAPDPTGTVMSWPGCHWDDQGTYRTCDVLFAPVHSGDDATDRALLAQVRAEVTSDWATPHDSASYTAFCGPTFHTGALWQFRCQEIEDSGSGAGDYGRVIAPAYVVDEHGVHPVTLDQIVVRGTNTAMIVETRCGQQEYLHIPADLLAALPQGGLACDEITTRPWRITATGIAFDDMRIASPSEHTTFVSQTIPYAAFGRLLRAHGVLVNVPHALDAVAEDTVLARHTAPPPIPAVISLLGDPLSLDALVWRWTTLPDAVRGSLWAQTAADVDAGPADAYVFVTNHEHAADAATALGVTARDGPSTDEYLQLWSGRATAPTVVRDAPDTRTAVRSIPEGTTFGFVRGILGDEDSGYGPWTYVAASPTMHGWARTRNVGGGAVLVTTQRAFLLEHVDADARDAATDDALSGNAPPTGDFAFASSADGARSWIVFAGADTMPIDGRIEDLVTWHQDDVGGFMIAIVTVVAGEPPGTRHWRFLRRASTETPTEAGNLVLLTGREAPTAVRVSVTTQEYWHHSRHTLVVRGPGRESSAYQWNGTTLVPVTE